MINIAINGFGRIGRQSLRIILKKHPELNVVAINDLTDNETLAHLFKFDSTYGIFNDEVTVLGDDKLKIKDKEIIILTERDPTNLPWKELNIDIVLECTGVFRTKEKASMHIQAGAKKVILSAPAKSEIDGTFVLGVNEKNYNPETHHIISNASCTTNCLAPVAKIINDNFGIKKGCMTTIHSYTNDQKILDLPHRDLRRSRAAGLSIIPTTTGAAKAVSLVIPELEGKLTGLALRVPTPTVSLVDLVCVLNTQTTTDEVNKIFKTKSENELKGILSYEERPLVSVDYRQNSHSAIIDAQNTKITGDNLLKVLVWYDNEWGYSSRLIDLAQMVGSKINK